MPTRDIHEAQTASEAQALAEWLGHRGIPAQLVPHADTSFGRLFAQGGAWGRVFVPEADVERARQSIDEWRALRADPEVLVEQAQGGRQPAQADSAGVRGGRVISVAWRIGRPVLLATSLVLNGLLFWRLQRIEPMPTRLLDADGTLIAEYFDEPGAEYPRRSVGHGKHGAIYEWIDEDSNGRPELVHELGPGQRPVRTWHDADQNGHNERRTDVHQGRVIAAWDDRDLDHLFEQGTFQPGDRPGARWLDLDKDGSYERFELVPASGRGFALIDSDRDGMPDRVQCDGLPAEPLGPLCAK